MLLATLLLPVHSRATADVFTASLSSNSVAVGDQVQITFTLNGSGRNFKAPPLKASTC